MKKLIGVLAALSLSLPAAAKGGHGSRSSSSSSHSSGSSSTGTHEVTGHTTKNGTFVKPHRQTNPNKTQKDNWSTKGNVNPDTGKAGTKTATH